MIGNHTLKCPNVVCFFDLIGRRTRLDDTASSLHVRSDKQSFCNRLLNDCEDYASLQQTELYASYLPRRHSPAEQSLPVSLCLPRYVGLRQECRTTCCYVFGEGDRYRGHNTEKKDIPQDLCKRQKNWTYSTLPAAPNTYQIRTPKHVHHQPKAQS